MPDAHAVLVGGGLGQRDHDALLASCPPDRTHFLGPRDDVPSLLSQADVLVLTSNSEGAPNVVLEALALGTPVVSTDVGDVPRMVGHGRTGCVVGNGEPAELAAAVRGVLNDRARFRESVRADLPRLEREYSLNAMITGTVDLWKEIAPGLRRS
jgi:glycosyltransferase involved in cell wall biosynthesis